MSAKIRHPESKQIFEPCLLDPCKEMLKHSRSYTTIHIVPPCSIFYVTKHCMCFSTSSLAETGNSVSIRVENERQTQNNAQSYNLSICANMQQVKPAAYLPVSKHAAVIATYAVLHHGHPSNLEHVLLNSTKGDK